MGSKHPNIGGEIRNPTGLGFPPTASGHRPSMGFFHPKKILFSRGSWLFFGDQGEILGETHTQLGRFFAHVNWLATFLSFHGASE